MVDKSILSEIDRFIEDVDNIEINQEANIRSKNRLMDSIEKLRDKCKDNLEALDIATHAIEILRQVSDEAIEEAYRFLEDKINTALERMFDKSVRKIRLVEYTKAGQYPQLEIELTVENGIVRSLRTDSGHGIAQTISLLSILSLIVITNCRRVLVIDEVIGGLSAKNREVIDSILWAFTEIGFQFIVNEHGFIPRGSNVYELEMVNGVSHVKNNYIEENGVYLDGTESQKERKTLSSRDSNEWSDEDIKSFSVYNSDFETAQKVSEDKNIETSSSYENAEDTENKQDSLSSDDIISI